MFRLIFPATLALAGLAVYSAEPPALPVAVARPLHPDEVRRKLGLLPQYASVPRIGAIKVAVLDSGFDGVGPNRPYLPHSAVVVEHYEPAFVRRFQLGDPEYRKPFLAGNVHGRVMAQLVWAAAGNSPEGPQFFLLNANGPTLFRRAVRYAIEQKVDVVLFSGTFEGAGNYDGRGPINAAVDEAAAAGILWVNAAGNCGGFVHNAPVERGPDGYLQFPAAGGLTSLRFRNRLDENAVTITLTWNDYRDVEDAGTSKDLDLYVEDARGRVVGSSTLNQVPAGRPTGEGETKNPRECLVLADLAATPDGQEYRIRVKGRSANFGPADRLRLLLAPAREAWLPDPATGQSVPSVEFLDATPGGEIYPPADHAGVLTVGDRSRASAVGPTADGRVKPDVVMAESTARFSNGEESSGSSNAAAYFAGVAAVLRAAEPRLTAGHVRRWACGPLDRRENKAALEKPNDEVPPFVIPPAPLSPNQQRAMKYAEFAAEEQRARGIPSPGVWVTGPRGTLVIRPGGRRPAVLPPNTIVPAGGRAMPSPASPPHVAWETPSPRALADLVRGGP